MKSLLNLRFVGRRSSRAAVPILLLLIGVSVSFLVSSCKKENIVDSPQENTALDVTEAASDAGTDQDLSYRNSFDHSICPQLKSTVYKSGGMLVFANQEHFERCVECLEAEVEAHSDAYESQYPTASLEQLDALDAINNFNEWQPLAQFEAQKSFSSLRAVVESQSQQWLNSQSAETINFDQDPDEICPIMDEETRTLFNASGYVRIGNQVISKEEWEDTSDAAAFWDCCAFLRSTKYTYEFENTPFLFERKVRARIKVKSGLVVSTLKGKIKHYRKVNGSYKKKRAKMRLFVAGGTFDGECVGTIQGWSAFKNYKNRKTRSVKSRIWSLWREALVCRDDPRYSFSRSGLGFFVDDESHGFALYLVK